MNVAAPVFVWLILVRLAGVAFVQEQWECLLVSFAALALVPLGLGLLQIRLETWYWLLSLSFSAAYLMNTPGASMIDFLAVPYFLLATWFTVRAGAGLLEQRQICLLDWVRVFALGYWATGAFWALCFLAGFRPLGFDPVIVSLTAAHFHLAGFVLSVIVWSLAGHQMNAVNRFLCVGVLLGMPLVATGITMSQLGYYNWIEVVSGIGFVALAMGIVFQHLRLSLDKSQPMPVRRLWFAGAVCLLVGGILAAFYALRFYFPLAFFNIPNMKVWHGGLNTLGFGWLVLRGWHEWRQTTTL